MFNANTVLSKATIHVHVLCIESRLVKHTYMYMYASISQLTTEHYMDMYSYVMYFNTIITCTV